MKRGLILSDLTISHCQLIGILWRELLIFLAALHNLVDFLLGCINLNNELEKLLRFIVVWIFFNKVGQNILSLFIAPLRQHNLLQHTKSSFWAERVENTGLSVGLLSLNVITRIGVESGNRAAQFRE